MMNILAVAEPPSCDCKKCQSMCHRPGWSTPQETFELMVQGYGSKLMLDYWDMDDSLPYTEIICPANVGHEGEYCGMQCFGQCVFFDKEGHCSLYGVNGRPIECRLGHCTIDATPGHYAHLLVAKLWNTDEGRTVVQLWKELFFKG